jgi:hypothetical protein
MTSEVFTQAAEVVLDSWILILGTDYCEMKIGGTQNSNSKAAQFLRKEHHRK